MKKQINLKKMAGVFHLLELALLLGVVTSVYSTVNFSAISSNFNNLVSSIGNFEPSQGNR